MFGGLRLLALFLGAQSSLGQVSRVPPDVPCSVVPSIAGRHIIVHVFLPPAMPLLILLRASHVYSMVSTSVYTINR